MAETLVYVLRRLLWLPMILVVLSLVTFALGRFGPGDPVEIRMGQRYDPEVAQRLRQELGLADPFFTQYGRYVWRLLHGDLGESLHYQGRTVAELVFPRIWVSAQLGLVSLGLIFALGIPVGIIAALRQGTWADPFAIGFFLLFQSIPVIVLIPVFQVIFVLTLHWFPASGWEGVFDKRIVLPVVALTLPGIAGVARLMRATTLNVLDEDYVRTARAKGLSEAVVAVRHVARNAMLPITTIIGLSLVSLLEGAFFTETLFGIPGVGRLAVDSVFKRDYEVIMALTLLVATGFVVANIAIDIVYTLIDPRIRYGARERA